MSQFLLRLFQLLLLGFIGPALALGGDVTVTAVPDKKTIYRYEPLPVQLSLKNHSDKTVAALSEPPLNDLPYFGLRIRKKQENQPWTEIKVLAGTPLRERERSLAPNKSINMSNVLAYDYNARKTIFGEVGLYEVQAHCKLYDKTEVASEILEITVVDPPPYMQEKMTLFSIDGVAQAAIEETSLYFNRPAVRKAIVDVEQSLRGDQMNDSIYAQWALYILAKESYLRLRDEFPDKGLMELPQEVVTGTRSFTLARQHFSKLLTSDSPYLAAMATKYSAGLSALARDDEKSLELIKKYLKEYGDYGEVSLFERALKRQEKLLSSKKKPTQESGK